MNDKTLEAVGRLRAWIRDYGHEKQLEFINDLLIVLDAVERQDVRSILLSPEFQAEFVKAFLDTPLNLPGQLKDQTP